MGISAKNNTIVPLGVWNLQSENPACPQDTHSVCTKQVAVTISREGAARENKHYGAQPPSAAGIVESQAEDVGIPTPKQEIGLELYAAHFLDFRQFPQ